MRRTSRAKAFERFSVGHELGHYFLEGHIDHVLPKDGVHTSHADSYPPTLMSSRPISSPPDFSCRAARSSARLAGTMQALQWSSKLTKLCKTSLTATAIRYAELTEDAVAIVISTGPTIDFCFMSETIKSLPHLSWLRKGTPVPPGTATAKLNANARRVAEGERDEADIDLMDWLNGSRSVSAVEQVVGLGNYGKTLTVITCPSLQGETYGEDDEEDEEKLADRWTPRFHR